ncbi:chemotaxis protein CheW [Candidatus Bathyarchaeota archaeon]|nr:chemotaxis protein CheW [Candidatus Bathyarchaeota archaeon]
MNTIAEASVVFAEEPNAVNAEEDTVQLVVFNIAQEEYGVEIQSARRIIKSENITMIPNTPDFLTGVINLRSQIVGVIDLEKIFLLKRDVEVLSKRILVVEVGKTTYGLLVDQVSQILKFAKNSIKEAPALITQKLGAEFVKGIGTIDNKLLVVLDLEKILSEKELIELSKISTKNFRAIGLTKKREEEIKEGQVPTGKLPSEKNATTPETNKLAGHTKEEEIRGEAPEEKADPEIAE